MTDRDPFSPPYPEPDVERSPSAGLWIIGSTLAGWLPMGVAVWAFHHIPAPIVERLACACLAGVALLIAAVLAATFVIGQP